MINPITIFGAAPMTTILLAAPGLADSDDAEEVRRAVNGFAEAWNHHDMEAFGKLFATDADFINVGGQWIKGRKAIQTLHAYTHGTIPAETQVAGISPARYGIFRTSTNRFGEIEVRFLQSEVALAHASWELLGDARTPGARRGMATFILIRQSGGWLIAAAHSTEIQRTVK
jgi:ketosteroid isomerase-like protein